MNRTPSAAAVLLTAAFAVLLTAGHAMAAEKKATRYARFRVGNQSVYSSVL